MNHPKRDSALEWFHGSARRPLEHGVGHADDVEHRPEQPVEIINALVPPPRRMWDEKGGIER